MTSELEVNQLSGTIPENLFSLPFLNVLYDDQLASGCSVLIEMITLSLSLTLATGSIIQ